MRGMAHLGVLRAMETLGIGYDAVVGTSIGSLVGAMAAGGYTVDKMASILKDVQKQDYFRLNVVKFLLKGARAPSMYRGDLFKSRLKSILPDIGFGDMRVPVHRHEVAQIHAGRVREAFVNRNGGEFDGQPAGQHHTPTDGADEFAGVAMTRVEAAAGVDDAHDRPGECVVGVTGALYNGGAHEERKRGITVTGVVLANAGVVGS
jgi:hypothetical protein